MTSDAYDKNYQIISSRWPSLAGKLGCLTDGSAPFIEDILRLDELVTIKVDGKHLTSRYDRHHEAEIQAAFLTGDAEAINVFGFALGDLSLQLLERLTAQIHIYIFDLHIFRYVISKLDFSEMFSNLRIVLHYADEEIVPERPYVVSPACLELADNDCLFLRDKVQIELATPYIRERFDKYSETWCIQIQENYQNIDIDHDVNILFDSASDKKSVVIGAGPSLDTLFDKIREHQKQGDILISVDGALSSLLNNNIIPDYVVTLDGQKDKLQNLFLKKHLILSNNISLIYFPVVHHSIVELWPGKRYVSYSDLSIFDEVNVVKPRGKLFVSGSVAHPAVDLAVKMGCSEIYLAGLDFSYPNNKTHVDGFYYQKSVEKNGHAKYILNGMGESVVTIQNLVVYLRDLEAYIGRQEGVVFNNMSKQGALIRGVGYF